MIQVMGIWQDVRQFNGQAIPATDFFWLDCPLKEAKEKLTLFLNRPQEDLLSSILKERPTRYVRVSRSFTRAVAGFRISFMVSRALEYLEIKPFDWTEWPSDDYSPPDQIFAASFQEVEEVALSSLCEIPVMASRTIIQAAGKDRSRLAVSFDNGVTKIVNLAASSTNAKRPDDSTIQSFKISERAASLLWPDDTQYGAQELYNMGIRCRMDFEEPVVEWYLSRFDLYLEGATVLFANSHETDAYHIRLFILFEQNGKWFRVDDVIIDWCDPTSCARWANLIRETNRQKLLDDIKTNGLGCPVGQDIFASDLKAFLNQTL